MTCRSPRPTLFPYTTLFRSTIVGGQDRLRGKVFRLAHMGYVDTFDVVTMIAAVEFVLHRLGHPLEWGAGVRAAQEIDRKSTRLNSSHSQISYAVFCLKKKND